MRYELLAADMDGTALNSDKIIPPETERAIHEALAQGYEVVFATGRAPAEMRPYLGGFPDMHYCILYSGGAIRDLRTGRTLVSVFLPRRTVEEVMALAQETDAAVVYFVGDEVYLSRAMFTHLRDYPACDGLDDLYAHYATVEDDFGAAFRKEPDRVHKINLYFRADGAFALAGERLRAMGLNFSSGLPFDYEISPSGVDKGSGLLALCEALHLSPAQAVACGDAGNDCAMLRAAGLGVAMANATEEAKAAADALTADCDHDGVGAAIRTYLGKETV